MRPGLKRRYEGAQERLIIWSAPTLQAEPQPLRPPLKPATAKLAEILVAKGFELAALRA